MRTGLIEHVFYLEWSRTPRAEDREPVLAALTEARRAAGRPLVQLLIVRPGCGLPDAAARAAMLATHPIVSTLCEVHYVVVETRGAIGVLVRGCLVALEAVSPRLVHFAASVSEALEEACFREGLDAAIVRAAAREAGLLG